MTTGMPRVIIFEGIASAGKTTLAQRLASHLFAFTGARVRVVDEDVTMRPLTGNTDVGVAQKFLAARMDAWHSYEEEILLVDRFLFSHAWWTHTPLADWRAEEKRLRTEFNTKIILLTVAPDAIAKRLTATDRQRGAAWTIKKHGSLAERTAYYIEQQNFLRECADGTRLAVTKIDTTDLPARLTAGAEAMIDIIKTFI